ncbi:hypothetical protein AB4084_17360, partial [Lysobacter sp. 2RAB21]
MSAAVAPLRAEHLHAALAFDASFLVDSRLRLHADDGAIGFDIVPVPPYPKRYHRSRINKTEPTRRW